MVFERFSLRRATKFFYGCAVNDYRRISDLNANWRYTGISRKMTLIRPNLCLLALVCVPGFADPPQPVIINAVTDTYRPLAFDQQKLTGVLAERMRANREGYLEPINVKFLATASPNRAGQDESASSEEQAGAFLDAAANTYEYSHDQNLKAVMDRVAKALLATQAANGDAGIHAVEVGASNTNNWTRRSDLLGLLAYYRVTATEAALTAAKKIGDLLVNTYGKDRAEPADQSAAILLEPLVYLYRYTGEGRYLDLCKTIAGTWTQSKEARVDPSYENLSTLQGLVELYRITGDEAYFRPALATWRDIRANELTLTGAISSNAKAGSNGCDACVTAAWMQLTLNLLRITGGAQYGEQLERTTYNQLFAAQDVRNGNIFSAVPLDGSKKIGSNGDPCAPSEARGVSWVPSAVWGRYGNGIAVVLYSPGRATFRLRRRGTIQLYEEATYPETGEILLHVEPSHNIQFPLRLRVPTWTSSFIADIDGSHLIGKPGEFLTIAREWKRGDTVKIAINMSVNVVPGAPAQGEEIAIQRGPQVLALGKTLNPELKDLTAAFPVSTDPAELKMTTAETRLPVSWSGDQAYSIPGEYKGQRQRLILVPFADAVDYRVWLKRPSAVSGAMSH